MFSVNQVETVGKFKSKMGRVDGGEDGHWRNTWGSKESLCCFLGIKDLQTFKNA